MAEDDEEEEEETKGVSRTLVKTKIHPHNLVKIREAHRLPGRDQGIVQCHHIVVVTIILSMGTNLGFVQHPSDARGRTR